MMFRLSIISFILLLFFSTDSIGQRPKVFDLSNKKIQIKVYDFQLSQVLDIRTNKENIGQVQVGMGNRRVDAIIPDFQKAIFDLLDPVFIGESRALVVRINAFEINEWTIGSGEMGMASLNISFLEKPAKQNYVELYTAILTNKIHASDVTSRTTWNIAEVFKIAIANFLKEVKLKEYDRQPISESSLTTYNAPEIPMDIPPSGIAIYKYYMDFLSGNKIEMSPSQVIVLKDKLKLKSKNHPFNEMWGITYNGDLYILMNKRFRKMTREESNYFISLKDFDEASVAAASMWFGLIGGALAMTSVETYRFGLNPLTGELDIQNEMKRVNMDPSEKYKEATIIEVDPFISKKHQFTLRISDDEVYNLGRGSFYLGKLNQTVEVCHLPTKSCRAVELPNTPVFLRLSFKKGELITEFKGPRNRQEYLQGMYIKKKVN